MVSDPHGHDIKMNRDLNGSRISDIIEFSTTINYRINIKEYKYYGKLNELDVVTT